MVGIVENLISELEKMGWKTTRTEGELIFSRGEIVITGHQEYVTAQRGDFVVSERSSRYYTTSQRLEFLMTQIRRMADMADTGDLAEMERWSSVQSAIQKSTWERCLNCHEALLLIEKGVTILQSS